MNHDPRQWPIQHKDKDEVIANLGGTVLRSNQVGGAAEKFLQQLQNGPFGFINIIAQGDTVSRQCSRCDNVKQLLRCLFGYYF